VPNPPPQRTVSRTRTLYLLLALVAALWLAAAVARRPGLAQTAQQVQEVGAGDGPSSMSGMPGMSHDGAGHQPGAVGEPHAPQVPDVDGAMAHEHMDMGPHMKMTAPRQRSAADDRRAAAIVETLRGAIARYKDYRLAVADGFVQYLPDVRQPMYHFTNWGYAYEAQHGFDPSRPTSLLYKPTAAGGFELVGAMYTAPRHLDEEQLDRRVPLSVAAWHQHVNICLPQAGGYRNADWRRFGFAGSIATAADCRASGGEFHPVIFGWMVHAYPFEQDPAKVWAH
jgi:hypothetical protein